MTKLQYRRFSLLALILCLGLAACGGGAGGGQPQPTITSVIASCSPSSIQVNQTSKCSATVAGTGSFSSAVSWSVDNGTIDQSGNYTAPTGSTTATVKATSTQDSTEYEMASITVSPATVALSALNFVPDSVVSGNISTGTATAATSAPAGGVAISLSSGDVAVASVPASVTIPAGSTSATFSVSTAVVGNITAVTIMASSATTVSSGLTVNPDAAVSWGGGPSPNFPVTGQCFSGAFLWQRLVAAAPALPENP